MRATNGRQRPSSGVPYTRIFAAFMLATLISTIFALPALAASRRPSRHHEHPCPKVASERRRLTYTVTVTNDDTGGTVVTRRRRHRQRRSSGRATSMRSSRSVHRCVARARSHRPRAPPGRGHAAPRRSTHHRDRHRSRRVGTADQRRIRRRPCDAGLRRPRPATSERRSSQNADLDDRRRRTRRCRHAGSDVTYTIAVNNNGPSAATGVSLTDTAAAERHVRYRHGRLGCTAGIRLQPGSDVPRSRALRDIPSGQTVTVTFVATHRRRSRGRHVDHEHGVRRRRHPTRRERRNNTVDRHVHRRSGVGRSRRRASAVDPTTAAPGDTVTYTVTVTNPDTTTDATNVVVTDALPAGLTAVTPPTAPTDGHRRGREQHVDVDDPDGRQGARRAGDSDDRDRDVRRGRRRRRPRWRRSRTRSP